MIVVVGFMGAGKTTVGRLLAAKLGVPFADSDHVIEDRTGKPIRRIFADDGEPAFRQLEHDVIAGLLNGEDMVLALGGGAAVHNGTRELLAATGVPVIYLRVSYEEAMRRVGEDGGRPVLARPDLAQIYAERDPLYAKAATLTIDTDARSPEGIALDILARPRSHVLGRGRDQESTRSAEQEVAPRRPRLPEAPRHHTGIDAELAGEQT